ncbi:MAG: MFS transporter [Negativicutes bacterium]|nr:MFS transporter [Negativicutes bacterium]
MQFSGVPGRWWHDARIIGLSSVGSVIEFYDFSIFILLAPYIAENFFTGSELVRLLETYSLFAVGYVARPLGGSLLAHFGDRYGRKLVFLLSIFAMAFATLAIGLIPGYRTIGVWAPVLLVVVRFVQGFALGAELPGAFTFVYEHMPAERKFMGIAIIISGIYWGISLGSLVATLLGEFFSVAEITGFAWRIPFWLGGGLALVGYVMRRTMPETRAFEQIKAGGGLAGIPFLEIFRRYFGGFAAGVVITAAFGTVMVFFYSLLPSYLITNLGYSHLAAFRLSTFNTVSLAGLLLLAAAVCRFDRLLPAVLAVTLAAIIGLSLLVLNAAIDGQGRHLEWYLLALSLFVSVGNPAYNLVITRLFPIAIRYSGVATTLNVANAFIGGVTPLSITWLTYSWGTPYAPAFYIAVVGVLGIAATLCIWRKNASNNNEASTG